MSARRLRVLMIGLLVLAAVLTAISGEEEGGPLFALAFALFVAAVGVFFLWRRKLRASVFAREERTPE
jgi:hypothetical protein